MAEPTLLSLPMGEFLDRLASSAPTPGAGAAAALCGAMAAGLGQMVCELTIGKLKFAAVEEEMRGLRERFDRARRLLQQLVSEDAAAYGDLSEAFKLPKSDAARRARIEAAADVAACVPLETVAVAAQVHGDAVRLKEIGNPQLAADTLTAMSLAAAAVQGAAANVRANLPLLAESRAAVLDANLQRLRSRI